MSKRMTRSIYVRMPAPAVEKISDFAKRRGMSLSNLIRLSIYLYMRDHYEHIHMDEMLPGRAEEKQNGS